MSIKGDQKDVKAEHLAITTKAAAIAVVAKMAEVNTATEEAASETRH
jgi:hypothetical protein